MRCALQVGWCDGSFVLPDTVIGSSASGVIFQSGERGHDEYTKAGTLTDVQDRDCGAGRWQSAFVAGLVSLLRRADAGIMQCGRRRVAFPG